MSEGAQSAACSSPIGPSGCNKDGGDGGVAQEWPLLEQGCQAVSH